MMTPLLLLVVLQMGADAKSEVKEKTPPAKVAAEGSKETSFKETKPKEESSKRASSKEEKASAAKDREKASEEKSKKKPTLFKRRKSTKDDAKKMTLDEEAPVVPDRLIPGPDAKPRGKTDLDRELMRDLVPDLEGAEEEADPLMRAGGRMRDVEERLARLDASGDTVELQKKILEDLEVLLQQQNNQNQNQNKKQQQQQKKRRQQQQQQQQQQRGQRQQRSQGKQVGKEPAKRATRGAVGREELGKDKDERDIWGHLGALMRDEMSQYAKEDFLPRYRELLEKYYTRIATESSRGSE
ncbi:hypothetical protein Pan216_08680 [Planctomycetes bacterium Pan216]|uniref:Uncharacterized protein n=1 Tax=Kolteria novifilia TaxID=2527975 RepID=A0A518AZA0_9BACT|nr:hypothetical protein Pan216_08680 [Planctomycetes bacterium Pan216]